MPNQILFSVIVPFRNETSSIGACLKALQQQSIGHDRYELLFVDNNSTDGTTNVLRKAHDVRIIREDKPGSYAARNAAARVAMGRFFAFTDADCVPEPDWLERAQEAIQVAGATVAVGPRLCPTNSSIGVQLLQDYENAKAEYVLSQAPSRFTFGWCSNMIIRADIFRRVGMFNEWERAADTAYLHRVRKHDPEYRIVFRRDMRVTHLEIRTAGQALCKMFVYGASNVHPAREYGYSPLNMHRRMELWRMCRQNPCYHAGHRLLLFALLVAGGLLYKTGEMKGRTCRR